MTVTLQHERLVNAALRRCVPRAPCPTLPRLPGNELFQQGAPVSHNPVPADLWQTLRAALLAAASLSILPPQPAAAADTGGFYVGADGGYTLSTYSHADLDRALVANLASSDYTLSLSGSSVRDDHAPWSVDVGYRFNPYFGLEASYLQLGTVNYVARGKATSLFGGGPFAVDLGIKSRGPALAFLGVLPLTNELALEAHLGAYEGKTLSQYVDAFDGSAGGGSGSQTTTSLLASLGGQYVIGGHWIVRLDYTRLNRLDEKVLGDSFDVSLLTAGVLYAF